MLKRTRSVLAAIAVTGLVSAGASLEAAPHEGHDEGPAEVVFKVGNNGEVNIRGTVRIGDSVLDNGKYAFEHTVEGEDHLFVFTKIAKSRKRDSPEPAVVRITIRSVNVLPGKRTSASTLLAQLEHDLDYRIVKIDVAGENMVHTF